MSAFCKPACKVFTAQEEKYEMHGQDKVRYLIGECSEQVFESSRYSWAASENGWESLGWQRSGQSLPSDES